MRRRRFAAAACEGLSTTAENGKAALRLLLQFFFFRSLSSLQARFAPVDCASRIPLSEQEGTLRRAWSPWVVGVSNAAVFRSENGRGFDPDHQRLALFFFSSLLLQKKKTHPAVRAARDGPAAGDRDAPGRSKGTGRRRAAGRVEHGAGRGGAEDSGLHCCERLD